MYSKAEKSAIKKEFWTVFGTYLKPVPNAEGLTINWINYKTGVKHIYIRMDADTGYCSIGIEIKHPTSAERNQVFRKFRALETIFTVSVGDSWAWTAGFYDEDGTPGAKIYTEKRGLNVLKKDDWPEIISFLKERLIALDGFWVMVKPHFEQ